MWLSGQRRLIADQHNHKFESCHTLPEMGVGGTPIVLMRRLPVSTRLLGIGYYLAGKDVAAAFSLPVPYGENGSVPSLPFSIVR
jgi:hypothetical protein